MWTMSKYDGELTQFYEIISVNNSTVYKVDIQSTKYTKYNKTENIFYWILA